jgi:hypothetical protein
MFQRGSFERANIFNALGVMHAQVAEPELASVGDVLGELGEQLGVRHAHEVDVERRVPCANERLRDPLWAGRKSGDPSPQGRVVERDLTPVATDVRRFEPAHRRNAERGEVPEDEEPEDPREELGR